MSRLSVYWPEENQTNEAAMSRPGILPFPSLRREIKLGSAPAMDVVTRARVLFSNRTCQECRYPVVEPIELADSTMNRSGLAIPGTATLIGFRCCGCQHEWPV
jgi:hypothetical protein